MRFQKSDNQKDYVCRECTIFLDNEELYHGVCPECKSDEGIFLNDVYDDEEE